MLKEMLIQTSNGIYMDAFQELVSNEALGIGYNSRMYDILLDYIFYKQRTVLEFVMLPKDALVRILDEFKVNSDLMIGHYIDLQRKIKVVYNIQ